MAFTPDANFQLLDQSCFPLDGMGVKERLKELQQLSKDGVINSATVDQGLITSTVMHVFEG